MTRLELTPDQLADADRLHTALVTAAATDFRNLADLLATKTDQDLFGATEFQVRDLVHAIGAKALQVTADLKQKRATTGPAGAVPTVAGRPNPSGGRPSESGRYSAKWPSTGRTTTAPRAGPGTSPGTNTWGCPGAASAAGRPNWSPWPGRSAVSPRRPNGRCPN